MADNLQCLVFFDVFQSFQDNGWVIMNGCVQWNHVYGWKTISPRSGNTRPVLHILSYRGSGKPEIYQVNRKEMIRN